VAATESKKKLNFRIFFSFQSCKTTYSTIFEKWSLFFKFASDQMHRNLINDIIKEKKEISMAAVLLQKISKEENLRAKLRSQRMFETDRISDLLTAEERGELREREKWQGIIADKNAEIIRLREQLEAR